MKISKRYGRRAFLGGGSVLISLPFLETFAPRKALGQAGSAPKRFLGYLYPNGMVMDDWRPVGTGTDFTFGPSMGASGRVFNDGRVPYPVEQDGPGLEMVKNQLLILSGLQNTQQEEGPGDHAGGIGSLLTNRTVPRATDGDMGGPSIDFVISETIGKDTRVPYIAMAGEVARPSGTLCDSGFSCAVGDHITFDNDGKNLPRFDNPLLMFDQLFAGLDPNANQAAIEERRALDKSVLDLVVNEATALEAKLSYQDRPRLQEYLTSVREVERRITNAASGVACTLPAQPTSEFNFQDGRTTIDICHELMALAFQCDATRVISYMWGNSSNGRPHNFIDAPGGHHDISHHGGNPDNVGRLQRIDYWWFRRFSEFLIRLQGMSDVDGRSVLDNTLVFQSSDVSDGDAHNHDDMPVILAGGAAGFTLGRHVQYEGNWFGELFVSIAQAFGSPITTFGEHGMAPLAGL
ncbi:MAG TPA: DUF1552 domain-containing protein [Polyangiaceae bacterium]|nr:DUF1552 domain-containing protein [Polyangiaceae bacterium]